jgi:hypothetical protein
MNDRVFGGDGLLVWTDGERLWFAPCLTEDGKEGRLTRNEVFQLRDSLQLWLEETHTETEGAG